MKQIELYNHLKSLEFPFAYNHFTEEQIPPYLVYTFSYSNDFIADDKNYIDIGNFQIELYTDKKDLASEKKVEDKLKEINLPYSKSETWIEEEKIYQILYQIQLI